MHDTMVKPEPGAGRLEPTGAAHHHRILQPFMTLEARTPPARVHGRDD